MRKIFLTGFLPFAGEKINPSQVLVERFRSQNSDLLTEILPVSFARAWPLLKGRLEKESVSHLLMLGQAGGRKNVEMERLAVNLMESEMADEDGVHHREQKIDPLGANAHFTAWPLRELRERARRQALPLEISNSAGLFVCNSLYYQSLNARNPVRSLFVHLPFLPEQTVGKDPGTPSLSLDAMESCVSFLLQELKTQ